MKKLTLFSLTWPIFIETALFMLLGFIDVYVLRFYDDLAASAVSTANQAVAIFTLLFSAISTASAVLISQNLGAKNKTNASRIAALSLTFNFIVGILVSVFLSLFSHKILSFIGATGKVLEYGDQYLKIVGSFIFLQAMMSALTVILRNHGQTKTSMYVTVIMNITNTVLDIVFVLGLLGFPKLGTQGVAIATSLSRLVGTVILFIIVFIKIEKPNIFRLLSPFPFDELKNILKIGLPSSFESFNYNVSQLVVTAIVLNFLTDVELITKTYVQNIAMGFYIFSVSIGQASQILTGHLVGAKQFGKAYKQGLSAFAKALAITMGLSVLGIIFREQIMGIFSENPAVITAGSILIILNIFIEFGRTSNLVLISSLRGAGDVFFPTGAAIFSMWAISTAGAYILAVVCGLGLNGLWLAFAADECFRGILMFFRWKGGKWRSKSLA